MDPAALRQRLQTARVLDGAMATELEKLGADITGPLWSAHVLEETPALVSSVHRAYLAAGADILLTASYQVSRKGYREYGLTEERADEALRRSVFLARQARQDFESTDGRDPGRPSPMIAASLGPYGAALHNGAEYHGNYDCSFKELVDFHQDRIAVLSETGVDLLAFETIPSLEEAGAIAVALQPWPQLAAWLAFTCPEPGCARLQVAHGEPLQECAALAESIAQVVAVGVNCTPPHAISSLIAVLRKSTTKPILVYPNSGERWDPLARRWTGFGDPAEFAALAEDWFAAGARMVGGCCRTGPDHICKISELARSL